MPIIPDPKTQVWKGQQIGNYKGDFVNSFNIDLESSNNATLKQSPSLTILSDRTSINYGIATHFIFTNADGTTSNWFASCILEGNTIRPILKATDPLLTAFAEVTSVNAPAINTQCYDMCIHGQNNNADRLVVARETTLDILNTSGSNNAWVSDWWGTTLSQATALKGTSTRLAKLEKVMAILDGNLVHTIDETDVVNNSRLVFNQDLMGINAMISLDRFWFGFYNKVDPVSPSSCPRGYIAEWDGFTSSYNHLYEVPGIPVCGFIINNIPYYVLSNGTIVYYDGSGFAVIQYLPMYDDKIFITNLPLSSHTAFVSGDIAYINLNVDNILSSYKQRAGIWCYDSVTNNLYHRYAFKSASQIGSTYSTKIGALVSTFGQAKFLASYATTKLDSSTVDYVISKGAQLASAVGNVNSSFVTPLILSNEVEDYWANIWAKYVQLKTANSKIIFKYRTTSPGRNIVQTSVTWTSATGGTLSSATGVSVGMEMELLSGPSAGSSYHIATLVGTTFTIDETPVFSPVNGNVSQVFIDDWIKISDNSTGTNKNPITDLTSNNKFLMTDNTLKASGTHVQFKIEFRDLNNLIEFQQLMVINKTQTSKDL